MYIHIYAFWQVSASTWARPGHILNKQPPFSLGNRLLQFSEKNKTATDDNNATKNHVAAAVRANKKKIG